MVGLLASSCLAQSTKKPSLTETFDWIANTIKPTEGNNVLFHRSFKVYPQDWVDKGIDPYHSEVITNFSHEGCRVKLEVEVADCDISLAHTIHEG